MVHKSSWKNMREDPLLLHYNIHLSFLPKAEGLSSDQT